MACADCHMPYRTEGGREVHRPPPAKPAAQHLQFVCRVPPLERAGDPHAAWSRSRTRSARPAAGRKTPWPRPTWTWPRPWRPGRRTTNWPRPAEQIRHAQLKWDYVAASNGMGFHSPAEALRILAGAVDLAGQARLDCARDPRPARLHAAGCLSGLQHQREGPGDAETVFGETVAETIEGKPTRSCYPMFRESPRGSSSEH